MCDRDGLFYRNFSRRAFLKSSSSGVAATIAVPASLASLLVPRPAFAATTLKATHGSGFCNLAFFLAKKRNLTVADGVELDFVVTPYQRRHRHAVRRRPGRHVDDPLFELHDAVRRRRTGEDRRGRRCAGLHPRSPRKASRAPPTSRARRIGTFQADTLEVLPYDYLKKAGLSFKDVQVRYFNTSPELAQAFIAGAHRRDLPHRALRHAMCLGRKGSTVLSDGSDLYGKRYSDCVLAVRVPLIEKNPKAVKAIIKAMMVAQGQAETDTDAALKDTVGKYYKTSHGGREDGRREQAALVDRPAQQHAVHPRPRRSR